MEPLAWSQLAKTVTSVRPVDGLSGATVTESDVRRRAIVAWALAHGTVDVAIRGLIEGIVPGLDVEGLTAEVAEATLRLVQRG